MLTSFGQFNIFILLIVPVREKLSPKALTTGAVMFSVISSKHPCPSKVSVMLKSGLIFAISKRTSLQAG